MLARNKEWKREKLLFLSLINQAIAYILDDFPRGCLFIKTSEISPYIYCEVDPIFRKDLIRS